MYKVVITGHNSEKKTRRKVIIAVCWIRGCGLLESLDLVRTANDQNHNVILETDDYEATQMAVDHLQKAGALIGVQYPTPEKLEFDGENEK